MNRFLRWSLWAYGHLLILYPEDLRRDFGAEMLEAFAHDLTFESSARGVKGVLRVWFIALREMISIALPGLMKVPAFAVPALSAAIGIVLQSPLLVMTIRRNAESHLRPGDATPLDVVFALTIAAAITALTSFVAVYRRKRAALISIAIG
jgi:hypothetical protein